MSGAADLLTALRAAFVAGDPLVSYFLDRHERRVVRVEDGRCNVRDVTAQEVEDDENRFAGVPPITTTQDFVWMQEFVDESDDDRISRLLDSKQGATKRFVKALPQVGPDAASKWNTFREGRLRERVSEWLAAVE